MNRISTSNLLLIVFFLMQFGVLKTLALNYTITFTGTGASTYVESIIVQNLTKGTSITVPAGNVLNLLDSSTAVEKLNLNNETICIYTNSVEGKSTLTFFTKQAGGTQISAYSTDGRKIAGITANLQIGLNSFCLSFPKGVYLIHVSGNGYRYTAKMINQNATQSKPEIVYKGTERPTDSNPEKNKSAVIGANTMSYTTGDRLLYIGISGNYSTIVTDVPTTSKTITFNFLACTDSDGNNYKIVKIGTQIWMAENLKTTKYNDGTAIPLVTDNTAWGALSVPGYCWYNNDEASYKNSFGALYNWYSVNTAKLAPTGWHVATDAEWTILDNYLIANGNYYGKSIAATTNWNTYSGIATVGNDLTKNNSTGFSGLPSSDRIWGSAGEFGRLGISCTWWSSSEDFPTYAWSRGILYGGSGVYRESYDQHSGFSVRCIKDEVDTTQPTLLISTKAVSNTTSNAVTSGGTITSDGGATITARGTCWNTSGSPTTKDNKTTDGAGTGSFTSNLTGLTGKTTYYTRAYATNNKGTVYGNQVIFRTAVTDIDGNEYSTVTIGTQTWLTENLKTTKYNDGTDIPLATKMEVWSSLSTPGYCWYDNKITNKDIYGALYNWYSVNTAKLAPAGWHVATDAEWTTLENYQKANSNNIFGFDLWQNNVTGFSARLGGQCNSLGSFSNVGYNAYWWTSSAFNTTYAWNRNINNYSNNMIMNRSNQLKKYGYSVRCIKDSQ